MKKLIPLFLFAVTAVSNAQTKPAAKPSPAVDPCVLCVVTIYDKMTGASSTRGIVPVFASNNGGRTGLRIIPMKLANGHIILSILAGGGGPCMAEDAQIIFLFTDGQRLQTHGTNYFNCDGDTGYFPPIDELGQLKRNLVASMRVYTYKSSVDVDFSASTAKELMKQLNCLDPDEPKTDKPTITN